MYRYRGVGLALLLCSFLNVRAQEWKTATYPVAEINWVRPSQNYPAQPVWGFVNGIRIGLSPMPGPRGLIKIYTPYLGQKYERVLNFMAIEPTVEGQSERGLSELEMSGLDGVRGKRFWSSDNPGDNSPKSALHPARGVVEKNGDVETLTVYIFSETFENGAKVYLKIRFYSDRPFEFEISQYTSEESAVLNNLIVTATMGNYPRLRNLYLADRVVSSKELWPDYKKDWFTEHAIFDRSDFIKGKNGFYYFISTPDEEVPQNAHYAEGTTDNWKYYGLKGTQYWNVSSEIEGVKGQVNGRYTYWGGQSPIPGGISFENFELKLPFREGNKMVYGVSPLSAEDFIETIKADH